MKTINFAIDLGTTNSLIAQFCEDEVKLYNNPLGLKQTLPSCIAFRGGRTVVGDKALDYLEKDAQNVCMLFKRKMGSQETYRIPSLDKEISPIELSSMILKELKNFVTEEEDLRSVVITIPASFDTIQSNATKKAGHMAGFEEVVLLQEPIAACLAFANKSNLEIDTDQNWIVYDFGGGTFDVALVKANDRELKVIDNAGDNFLGGADFDSLIVEKILVPLLEKKLGVTNLWSDIKQKDSSYKGLYFELLNKAEEAKKELSVYEQTEVEIDTEINGNTVMEYFTITRGEFEAIIKDKVDRTIDFIKEVIANNNLEPSQIERLILIGGSTYVPLIRQKIKEEIGVLVDSSINPTSAVVEGAGYYAGSKPRTVKEKEESEVVSEDNSFTAEFFYEQNTRDLEELITAKITGVPVANYRVTRSDGGYDSGIKELKNNSFAEFAPLLKGSLNRFKVQFLDANSTVLKTVDSVAINQGSYNVQGQPLPNDICMEIDDIDSSTTRLEKVFGKGSILPLKKKIYKTASKSIIRNSDANLIINIIEGKSGGLPSSGLSIGYIEISGKQLQDDLIKGTDIEIELEVTESRDIKINVYLQACDQEFQNVFSQSERAISMGKITMELNSVVSDVESLISENNLEENFEFSKQLEDIRLALVELQIEASLVDNEDVSDKKYQIDDAKRKLIHEFDGLTRNKLVSAEIEAYKDAKESLEVYFAQNENDQRSLDKYKALIASEKSVIHSGDKYLIAAKVKELKDLYFGIIQSKDENFIQYFFGLKMSSDYTDQRKADQLLEEGDRALAQKDYKSLRYIVYSLFSLLPEDEQKRRDFNDDSKTGLS